MLIDWFTVGAQVLNFLILVWLLKRFLYHPILTAIDAREERIAAELADAAAKKAEASRERQEFQDKSAAFDKEKAALFSEATAAANAERQRLLDAARQDAAALNTKRQENLQREAQGLRQEISRRTRQEVFAIARKALKDLAGASLEERMVEVFIGRLQALSGAEKQTLQSVLQAAAKPLIVRTRFDLPIAQQAACQAAITALLGETTEIRFATATDLVSGIELSSDGQKVAWSLADYLDALESSVGELLQERARPKASQEAVGG
ncbi:MAG: F0F1 ATP synthase subunit B [Betaproteobacteria bacterium HGW-Betaproteobacteria-10]|nr:MAG: F0F1 ATP synthase subunit B [Betaproteobacteria bacterium HGW-Betaproteobacteria-10]